MTSGPTQNYADPALTARRARPVLALAVRVGVVVGPFVLALGVGLVAALWFPPERLGLPGWLWLVGLVLVTSAALLACSRWLRRLAPLPALLKLSLVLPDDVPHRFSLARRRWSPAALDDAGEDTALGQRLLALVATLAAHDDRTRAHGERVQAYAALIGREMGLPAADVDRLSWVALLHDVGKVHVPVEVINKNGRPSEEEWAQLQSHPHHGGELVQPLRDWLGDWLDGVEQHHERWDGRGYPRSLAGEDISLAARVIAVADTYDVITSARAYKKPMTAEQARAEITRCAGEQFDPAVVRALLSVGIGKLRRVAGPATLLAAIPLGVAAPAQAASGAVAAGGSAGAAASSTGSLLASVAGSAAATAGTHALAAVAVAVAGVGGAVTASAALDLPAAAASARIQAVGALTGDPVLVGADEGGPSAGTGSERGAGGELTGAGAPSGSAPGAASGAASGAGAVEGAETGAAAVPTSAATPSVAAALEGRTSAPSTSSTSGGQRLPLSPTSSSVVGVPPVTVVPGLPAVTVPPVSVPPVSAPSVSVPRLILPSVSVPPVSVPSVPVPSVSVPSVSVPSVSVPSVSTSLPSLGLGGSSLRR